MVENEFTASPAIMTFLRVSDGQVFTEPLVPLKARPSCAWTHFEFEHWNGFVEYRRVAAPALQLVPASIASRVLQLRRHSGASAPQLHQWAMATRHRCENPGGLAPGGVAANFKYHCKDGDGKKFTNSCEVVDVYEIERGGTDTIVRIKCFGTSSSSGILQLMDVSTFNNFVGFGPAPTSEDEDEDEDEDDD